MSFAFGRVPKPVPYERERLIMLGYAEKEQRSLRDQGGKRKATDMQGSKDINDSYRDHTISERCFVYLRSQSNREKHWLKELLSRLAEMGPKDLAIIHFAGDAGPQSTESNLPLQDYCLNIRRGYPKIVNFYKVFALIRGCRAKEQWIKAVKEQFRREDTASVQDAIAGYREPPATRSESQLRESAEEEVEDHLHKLDQFDVACDILLLFDAQFPAALINNFRRTNGGSTVALIRPELLVSAGKKLMRDDDWFSSRLATIIEEITVNIDKHPDIVENHSLARLLTYIGKKDAAGAQDLLTCPAYLKAEDNGNMGGKIVTRPVVDIGSIRKYGKLQMLRLPIQGVCPEPAKPFRMERQKTRQEKEAEAKVQAGHNAFEDGPMDGRAYLTTSNT